MCLPQVWFVYCVNTPREAQGASRGLVGTRFQARARVSGRSRQDKGLVPLEPQVWRFPSGLEPEFGMWPAAGFFGLTASELASQARRAYEALPGMRPAL